MSSVCLNDAEPLWLGIGYHNVSADGTKAPAWGVQVDIGTPPQGLILQPSLLDFSLVSPMGSCSSAFDYDCLAYSGGMYDDDFSTTEQKATDQTWNSTLENGLSYNNYDLYYDSFAVGVENKVVYGVPFATVSNPANFLPNFLGIGNESVFTENLARDGIIPTRSWGIWPGSRDINNYMPGGLVLGGYDSSRVKGDFSVIEITNPNCARCIQIMDLAWVNETGSFSLFNATTESFWTGLDFRYTGLEMPLKVWENLANVTGVVSNSSLVSPFMGWLTQNAPNGSLAVTVKDAYTVNIPASELISPPLEYDSNGALRVVNDSIRISNFLPFNDTTGEGYIGNWGLPFLTMNYFIMEAGLEQFRMAPAIRSDSRLGADIKKLCTPSTPTTSSTSTTTTQAPTSPVTTTPPPTPSPTQGPSPINTGAIVGGVVGGVGGIALILLGIWFFIRRRKRTSGTKPENGAAPPPVAHNPAGGDGGGGVDLTSRASVGYPVPISAVPFPSPPMTHHYPTDAFGQQYSPVPYPPPPDGFKPQVGYPYPITTAFGQPAHYPPSNQHSGYYYAAGQPPADERGASPTNFSDGGATAVHELSSPPTSHVQEWVSSQNADSVVTEVDPEKRMNATVTSPPADHYSR